VLLVRNRATEEFGALKVLEKARVVKSKQVEHTINEKMILSAIDFPFLVHLHASFKDNSNLFIVMEVCKIVFNGS
jgi:protein kinase A